MTTCSPGNPFAPVDVNVAPRPPRMTTPVHPMLLLLVASLAFCLAINFNWQHHLSGTGTAYSLPWTSLAQSVPICDEGQADHSGAQLWVRMGNITLLCVHWWSQEMGVVLCSQLVGNKRVQVQAGGPHHSLSLESGIPAIFQGHLSWGSEGN